MRVSRKPRLSGVIPLNARPWAKPTVCPGWNVCDLTAHILNDYQRRISGSRDWRVGAAFADDETLPTHLARINDEFISRVHGELGAPAATLLTID